MKVVGLFSGIGGLELPFHQRGIETTLLCDVWDASQVVLKERFKETEICPDIKELKSLPKGTDIITAGFPCTDLSQAGKTAGIAGQESSLVDYVFKLLESSTVEWLVLENVRNMLVLDKGHAMHHLTSSLEKLGFRWAYRLVDSRFSGTPQRRHRVLMVASRHNDPREVLFADDATEPNDATLRDDAFGFYWTEGLRGLGWAKDAVPPLKGGSSIGIPSPPAIWMPKNKSGHRIVTPSIEAAEELQGFTRGWTKPAQNGKRNGPRWKLVGNAVSVGVADWLVQRLLEPGFPMIDNERMESVDSWPTAAYGEKGHVWRFDASLFPQKRKYRHLTDLLRKGDTTPLSRRATQGFFSRTQRASLRFKPDFIRDLEDHISYMEEAEFKRSQPSTAGA